MSSETKLCCVSRLSFGTSLDRCMRVAPQQLVPCGHGYFRSYLDRRRRVRDPSCRYCRYGCDDAEHTFFECAEWDDKRAEIESVIGSITLDNVVWLMLSSPEWWTSVYIYVSYILRRKYEDGCLE